jgi:hypothetical protein
MDSSNRTLGGEEVHHHDPQKLNEISLSAEQSIQRRTVYYGNNMTYSRKADISFGRWHREINEWDMSDIQAADSSCRRRSTPAAGLESVECCAKEAVMKSIH